MCNFIKEQMDMIGNFEKFSPSVEKDFLKQPYADTLINHYTSVNGLMGILNSQNYDLQNMHILMTTQKVRIFLIF